MRSYCVLVMLMLLTLAAPVRADEATAESWVAPEVIQLDRRLDWERYGLIAVQDAGRYKTLDSFAREAMVHMTGKEHFPGLSPIGSLLEWLFNRQAYADVPVIRLKDKGIRLHLVADLPAERRQVFLQEQRLTLRELESPAVQKTIRELAPRQLMAAAMNRVGAAQFVARFVQQSLRIVPSPEGVAEDPWYSPYSLVADLPDQYLEVLGRSRDDLLAGDTTRVPGITQQKAAELFGAWAGLQLGWMDRDAVRVAEAFDRLSAALPETAAAGVYPDLTQRKAEARYYKMGKFTGGWLLYFFGILISVMAVMTRWKVPWVLGILVLVAAMGLHAYGLSLRWYILGRIPVANMFEAVVASAWAGIAIALLLELVFRTRVFLVAANATGFLALVMATFVIPGGGTLTTIMGILDDVMLRIHTVLIIASYALIFVAAVIATIYLFGYYLVRHPVASAESGLAATLGGGLLFVALANGYISTAANASGVMIQPWLVPSARALAGIAALALLVSLKLPRQVRATVCSAAVVLLLAGASLALTGKVFVEMLAWTLAVGGLIWTALTVVSGFTGGYFKAAQQPEPALAVAGGADLRLADRPILAGGAPGDESQGRKLPLWLHHADWSHLIVLNMVFVMLFVGIILGAIWADYSWGRPWGWDPKEVFALNTWIIYAILIHIRFVTRNRGLWTAWLSVAGCAMMAFNWVYINFHLVGLHSYA